MIKKLVWRLLGRDSGREKTEARSNMQYWENRVRKHGARSVLNINHTEEEMAAVTERQKEILFPLLRQQLRGDEQRILDFGCGPGRFTPGLAELVGGRAIGVDPMQDLLDLAPRTAHVEYRRNDEGVIPLDDASVDVAWICLVLGVITEEDALQRTVAEVERVLRPGGLLFLVENTADKPDLPHIKFRSPQAYQDLFPSTPLALIGEYEDLGERISILAGRMGDGG